MTPKPLRSLITEWRERAETELSPGGDNPSNCEHSAMLGECADELEALLDAWDAELTQQIKTSKEHSIKVWVREQILGARKP